MAGAWRRTRWQVSAAMYRERRYECHMAERQGHAILHVGHNSSARSQPIRGPRPQEAARTR